MFNFKMNKPIKYILVFVLIFLACAGSYYGFVKYKTANAIQNDFSDLQEQEDYRVWLYENCACLERKLYSCWDGFELNKDGDRCVSLDGKSYTRRLISCSKYDCHNGDIRSYDFEKNQWDIPEGFKGD